MNSLAELLQASKVSYQLLPYPANITDPTEAAANLGMSAAQMIKSLVVKVDNKFVMFLLPLTQRLPLDKLKLSLQVHKVRMAMPDEAWTITGYKVGTICPFLLKSEMPIFIDANLLQWNQIAISAGEKGKELLLSPYDLKTLVNAKILEI
ncbi:MAG: hypothetical protein HY817_05705 [Candidatus Abawacabacteria bacterium]|nr:hypothetical protein [Candidatus Abawacabacteria bacterium]